MLGMERVERAGRASRYQDVFSPAWSSYFKGLWFQPRRQEDSASRLVSPDRLCRMIPLKSNTLKSILAKYLSSRPPPPPRHHFPWQIYMCHWCLSQEAFRVYSAQGTTLILEWKHQDLKRKGKSKQQNPDRNSPLHSHSPQQKPPSPPANRNSQPGSSPG